MNHNPFELFNIWYADALKISCKEPNVMVLATCNKAGYPSARPVLLKQHDHTGFVFFTNFSSRKAQDMDENPHAALLFYWMELDKQVRIEGEIKYLNDEESDRYYASRPRESQVAAWSSKQSQIMENADDLAARVDYFTEKFAKHDIPRPKFWGGIKIIPTSFEFWQDGEFRLHTRYKYLFNNKQWEIKKLYP